MDAKQLLEALDLKSIPCEYCDVRIEETFESSLIMQNHELTTAVEQNSVGAFLRVRQHGQWYFSSTTDLATLKEQLTALANSKSLSEATPWGLHPDNNGTFESISYRNDNPSQVAMAKKVEMIEGYDVITKKFPKIKTSSLSYKDIYKVKTYKNSSGTFFQFDFAQCGWGLRVNLADGEKTYSDVFKAYGEKFSDILNEHAKLEKYLSECEQFIHAPLLDAGKYKVLMSPEIAGVFVHESFGHNSEADSMIGDPRSKEIFQIGKKVAADFVSIVDSGLHKGGSGYCPIDDEGYLATKTYLIKDGVLTGRLHSFDTAVAMDEKPTGNARALNFEYEPIVRMTSTYIENGNMPLSDLYKMAEGGILIETFKYGTGGELFTIAPGRAFLIKDGKATQPVRANVMSGQLFETLLNIEGIANDYELTHSALGGCGKMDQMPLPVSDGGPTILVKDMQVS